MTTLHTYISVKKIPTKVIDGTMIVEEYLGTSDGAARSPPLRANFATPPPPKYFGRACVRCFSDAGGTVDIGY